MYKLFIILQGFWSGSGCDVEAGLMGMGLGMGLGFCFFLDLYSFRLIRFSFRNKCNDFLCFGIINEVGKLEERDVYIYEIELVNDDIWHHFIPYYEINFVLRTIYTSFFTICKTVMNRPSTRTKNYYKNKSKKF